MSREFYKFRDTAESWAERWREESQDSWVWPTVEVWAYDTLVANGETPLIGSAHFLTSRLMEIGKKAGWWSFDRFGRRWRKK